jgi:hypothetical protein
MKRIQLIKEKRIAVNTIETDFRAEVVAAGLIENGEDADKTHIIRRKGNLRSVSKDIETIDRERFDSGFDSVEYLCIYASRDGIYDALPEGMFHQRKHTRKPKTSEEIVREIRDQAQEEIFARKYFQPFEMVLDKVLIEIQFQELKYDKAHLYDNLTAIFREQWDILQYLPVKQALLFIRFLPLIEAFSRSFELTAKIMGVILDCPVSVSEGKKMKSALDQKDAVTLGKWKLGLRSVPGKTIDSDSAALEITVGPISPGKMQLFEFEAVNDRILKCLIDLTIPFDRNTIVKYRIVEEERKFRLSDKTHKAYLGMSTTLCGAPKTFVNM